ncbi:Protein CBG24803 [Caenorhabditis briggsae]|uniref:Protein CBG24803 n=1 Tax=Caenorhabditis briggsae TaxID=6238 RepID=A8WLI7_CAEBR|nr:Protein CBG24803 [Caenorhabditis briggsae]CAP21332.2 Protein CBG24803 [Caenorhabditis briggsae]
MPNLPDMPEEVLKIILKDADLRRILSLRKVCHQMRDLLDQMDFDFGIDQIQISRKLYETDLEISTGPENFLITYQWKPAESEPCIILDGIRTFEILESKHLSKIDAHNRDYDSLFFGDLRIILKFVKNLNLLKIQTIPDNQFNGFYSCPINTLRFYNNFERYLKSENIYLKVGTLNFVAHSQHQVLQILPFIHSNFLETLDIVLEYPRHPEHLEAIQSIKIDKITELDQWKNAENLRIQGLIFPPKIKDFEHFELVEISIATVVEDELREIKEAFFNENSRLNCFEINYIHMDVTTLLRVFGFPENRPEDSADSENWYFPIKDDQILLKIGHYPLEDANHEQLDPIYSSILFLKCFKIPE